MRIGIFGGTFSPPHMGHVRAAEAFIREARLDRLLIIPTFISHTGKSAEADAAARLAMCRLAFRMPCAEVLPIEICRGGISYTAETLDAIRKTYPDDELYLLLGSDKMQSLESWHRANDIISQCIIVCADRERKTDEKNTVYMKQSDAGIRHIRSDIPEISSTEIRRKIKDGESISGLVPREVSDFIEKYKLFTEGKKLMFDEKELDLLREKVKGRLSEYRYKHTIGVEQMAVRLGRLLAPDKIPTLRAAALLHDITKENSYEKQLQICENVGIIISYVQKMTPKTLHAVSAAALIPSEFPEFAEEEVLSAVRAHTTGNENMSVTDEIIYLADYIEENRTFEDCVTLRNYFFASRPESMTKDELELHFKKTLLLSFDMTMHELLRENSPIDTATAAARNALIFCVTNHEKNGGCPKENI